MLDSIGLIVMFVVGAWNGWMWREIAANRRLRRMRHSDRHADA